MNVQSVKISKKGQITIPKELREKYKFKEEDEIILIETNEGILIKPKSNELIKLRGILRQEIDLKKAEEFIIDERKKWRI
ncbi:MAG: AbrB/MazE/SpoVT family DNA-binding domain-containing protein [Candidatus Hodarchaeota archaeon]